MLAGKGRRWPKGRALFVFRQDSGIIAWRSDLQVLYEAHLVLAACSESWFPWKTPDSMWQGLFAVVGVIVHSCHSSLWYLLQSTLTLAASSFNTCSPSPQRLSICSRGRTKRLRAFLERTGGCRGVLCLPALLLSHPGHWESLHGWWRSHGACIHFAMCTHSVSCKYS